MLTLLILYCRRHGAEKYKGKRKMGMDATREHDVPKVKDPPIQLLQQKHIDAAFAKYKTDDAWPNGTLPEEIEKNYGMTQVPSAHMSIVTTSPRRKSTARYSTPNFTSTCQNRPPKMTRLNTTLYRKPWKNTISPGIQFTASCNSTKSNGKKKQVRALSKGGIRPHHGWQVTHLCAQIYRPENVFMLNAVCIKPLCNLAAKFNFN